MGRSRQSRLASAPRKSFGPPQTAVIRSVRNDERFDAITVEQLCAQYLEAARAGLVTTRFKRPKRASTVAIDEGRVARHIVPLIGDVSVKDLKRSDVQRMADAIASGKTAGVFKGKARGRAVATGGSGTACRVVELLGGIYSWAEKRDLVQGPNPTRGVETIRGEPKERVLSPSEMAELGKALRAHEAKAPIATAAISLTGLRRSEACRLRWREIDEAGHCLRLEATKTGRSVRPVSKQALALLRSQPREDGAEWIFARVDGKAPAELKKPMKTIFAAAAPTVGAQNPEADICQCGKRCRFRRCGDCRNARTCSPRRHRAALHPAGR